MLSPGNLDYKKTLQDLFTVTFNLMIIIILKIVAVAYSASLHMHLTGICDRKEPGTFDDFREVSVTGGERKTDSQTEGGKEGERKRGEMKQDKIKAWS